MEWAVLLMAYGGPDSLDDVEPYLLDVRGGRATPPELVEEIRERYAKIGGRSPLLALTRAQAEALEQHLNLGGCERYKVFVGMRHWTPYISQAVNDIKQSGLRNVVALAMAPYYSRMSIGAYKEKLYSALSQVTDGSWDVHIVDAWNTNPLFVQSLAGKVLEGLVRFPASERSLVRVVFTAHSLPAAIMSQGDPYADQFGETARLVAQAAGLPETSWQTAFQSAGAQNTRWLGPTLEEVIDQLAGEGVQNILVAPIGFVSDHVEILYDIDQEVKAHAGRLGVRLERTRSSNDSPDFIDALADIVLKNIETKAVENGSHGA